MMIYIYGSKFCPRCDNAKAIFEENNISYKCLNFETEIADKNKRNSIAASVAMLDMTMADIILPVIIETKKNNVVGEFTLEKLEDCFR